MKITSIEVRPLRIPYKKPFHWAQGVVESADVILVCVHTDEGIVGYGESMSSAPAAAVQALLQEVSKLCIGQSPFEITALMTRAYQHLFAARGTCSAPRFAGMVLAGLDMALWDALGKATGRSVCDLLGGPVRRDIQYFGFPQGDTAAEVAAEARRWIAEGCDVIYVKVGRNEQLDLAIVEEVRAAIGNRRLRVDANEAWDLLTARRMIEQLSVFGVEFVEQPTRSASISALKHIKESTGVAIAADQVVFTPEDVFEVCQRRAADLIVLGLHETGGIGRFCQAAAIAQAAGLNICLHGLYETGITTCASNQVAAALTNLDDGNQYMNHFLLEDVIQIPRLKLNDGRLPVLQGPGLGFDLDWDAVKRAEERVSRN